MDIRECAKAIDLDLESIACLGRSIKPAQGKRLVFNCDGRLKSEHKYAIKHFGFEKVYINWQNKLRRQIYSLRRIDFMEALSNYNGIVEKGVGFRWKDMEEVYVIEEEHIMDFLQKIKDKESEHI